MQTLVVWAAVSTATLSAAALPCPAGAGGRLAVVRVSGMRVSGTQAPEAQVPEAPRVVRISGGVMAGQNLTKVPPVYPPEAKGVGVQGTVVLHAIIAADGHVQTLTAVSGPAALREAALEAVSQWTYRPYLLNGQPTAVDTTVMVTFSLTP